MIRKITLIIVLTNLSMVMNAQFFRGIGIFAGGTSSRHSYVNSLPLDSIRHTIPVQSHRSAEYLYWSAGILFEFLKYENIRWQSEFEYCKKGAIENPFITWNPPTRSGKTLNSFTNIEWNNYLKILFPEGYRGTPYIMLGARLDYNLARSITAFPTIMSAVKKINVSPDVVAGFEFVSYYNFKPFIEAHYNPDILKTKVDVVSQRGRMWELRIGIIYRPQKSKENCNAPSYNGSAY
ncbi:MAG: hypothetical protein ACK504_06640 [Bacteroidota bacterium]